MLGIETSSGKTDIALFDYELNLLDHFSTEDVNNQSKDLARIVETILSKNKVLLSELNRVAVCIGPGSFTGIRVACAFVQGLLTQLPNSKTYGFTSLELYNAQHKNGLALVKCPPRTILKQEFDGLTPVGSIIITEAAEEILSSPSSIFFKDLVEFYDTNNISPQNIEPFYFIESYYK